MAAGIEPALKHFDATKVDAIDSSNLDENHHDRLAGRTSGNGARSSNIDHELGDLSSGSAACANAGCRRHLGPEHLGQPPGDRIAIESFHQLPPVAPNRSVFTLCGW